MSIIPNLLKALAQGFTSKQALDWIVRNNKKIGKTIRSALDQGYEPEQITEYLTKGKSASYSQRQGMLQGMREKEQADAFLSRGTDWEKLIKTGAKAGTLAVGAYGLARGLPALARSGIAQNILQRLGLGTPPNVPGNPSPASPQAGAPGGALQPNQQTLPPNTQAQPSIQRTQTQAVQSQSQNPPIDSASIIQQMQLAPKINTLLKAGNAPDVIGAVLEKQLKPGERKWLDEQIKTGKAAPLPQVVADFIQKQPQTAQITPESTQTMQPAQEVTEPKIEEPKKLEKGSVVATPDGQIGEIESERNGQALIKADGKLHKVKIGDIEQPPEELIEAVKTLLDIPEVDRSSVISLLTYRPSSKQMFIQYHNGESYVYEDFPEEQANEIAVGMGVPVTTGKNIFGAWNQGEEGSRGAALIHGAIRTPKYSKENEGKTWEKLGTYYDYWKKLRKPSKRKKKS